ncbi:MAG TPA: SDR family NAD(P)-dependent oxidoreductase [Opitutaceae bacterium]|nr:SDR family NAD(P)-dependent oxidoreductase [Opitutaceae bacterium]
MRSLSDQVVIVTGASAGIGEAVARRLARAGARLVLGARRADRLAALAKELDPSGGRVLAVPGDVAVDADRRRLVETALARFGRVDALVNNAGYGTRGPVELVPVDLIRRNYETNVIALVALAQLVAPHLRRQGAGRIVNIGSVAGRIARPFSSIYDSTKHAVEALTDGLRGELKPFGVGVVLIRPGFIVTEFVDAANQVSTPVTADPGPYAPYFGGFRDNYKRWLRWAGRPDDIARLVERALTARRPAPRYAAPFHAKVFLFLKWALPARFIDFLVRARKA